MKYRARLGAMRTRWQPTRREAQLAAVARGWGSSEDEEPGWRNGPRPAMAAPPKIYLDAAVTIEEQRS